MDPRSRTTKSPAIAAGLLIFKTASDLTPMLAIRICRY
jgi:hypothetical protein